MDNFLNSYTVKNYKSQWTQSCHHDNLSVLVTCHDLLQGYLWSSRPGQCMMYTYVYGAFGSQLIGSLWLCNTLTSDVLCHLTHWDWDKMATISQMTFLNAFSWIRIYIYILIKISTKFVPKVQIYNIPALVQMMAWHWLSDKPLSEPMMVSLLRHILSLNELTRSHPAILNFHNTACSSDC